MITPAPTPAEKALKRVLIVSALDGWGIVSLAVLSILITLFTGNLLGSIVGLFITAAGWMELRGRGKLKRRDPEGMRWLVRSQMFLLGIILVYCARNLGSFDEGYLKDQVIPEMRQYCLLLGANLDEILQPLDLTADQLVPWVHKAFIFLYVGVAAVSFVYQGGMSIYYRRKIKLVTEALTVVKIAPPSRGVL